MGHDWGNTILPVAVVWPMIQSLFGTLAEGLQQMGVSALLALTIAVAVGLAALKWVIR